MLSYIVLFFVLIVAFSDKQCVQDINTCETYRNVNVTTKFDSNTFLKCLHLINPNCYKMTLNKINCYFGNTPDIESDCPGTYASIGCWKCNDICVGNNCICQGKCQLFNIDSICCSPGQSASCQCKGCSTSCFCSSSSEVYPQF